MTAETRVAPTDPEVSAEARRVERWQLRLLPFMMVGIAGMALFFFVATLVQFYYFQARALQPSRDLSPIFASLEKAAPDITSAVAYTQFRVAAALEEELIARRYQQVNNAMLARVWTRYVGFLTGMILALVGSIFILGKLRIDASQLGVTGQGVALSLSTTSPGIILAVLGAGLLALTIAIPFELKTTDVPVYLGARALAPAASPETKPATLPIDEIGAPPDLPAERPR